MVWTERHLLGVPKSNFNQNSADFRGVRHSYEKISTFEEMQYMLCPREHAHTAHRYIENTEHVQNSKDMNTVSVPDHDGGRRK